ncbi:MAG: ABC transporter permease [Bacteroidota bacterium]
MLKNYFKTAFRNLKNNKFFSLVNIVGLSLAIAVCTLAMFYVKSELSFDRFHSKSERIYRIISTEKNDKGYSQTSASTPIILGETLGDTHPEIEAFTRVFTSNQIIKTSNQNMDRESIVYVDKAFFEIFDFPIVKGNSTNAFSKKNSVLINKKIAKKYFGTTDVLGKTMEIELGDGFYSFEVEGIMEDMNDQSSLVFDMAIPLENMEPLIGERGFENWFFAVLENYFLMSEDFEKDKFEESAFNTIESNLGESAESTDISIWLQPLSDVHLNIAYSRAIAQVKDKRLLIILSGIAIIILIIAVINSTTLAIGRSIKRSKEVGVRKVVGAGRAQLVKQFMVDAALSTFMALLIGIFLSTVILPSFNTWFDTQLTMSINAFSASAILILLIAITFLSGFYPSLILSSFKTTLILKNQMGVKKGKNYFRKSLLTLQFTMSVFLIVCTIAMYSQMNYIFNKDLGYSKDFTMNIPVQAQSVSGGFGNYVDSSFHKAGLLKNELNKLASVKNVTRAVQSFETTTWMRGGFVNEEQQTQFFKFNVIDAEFVETMNLEIIEGRNFDPKSSIDKKQGVLVNEAFLKHFNVENPIGQSLPGPKFTESQIIGVLKNFHFESLKNEIEPLVLVADARVVFRGINDLSMDTDTAPDVIVKFGSGDISKNIEQVRAVYSEVFPSDLFEFSFIDETIEEIYQQEKSLNKMITSAALIAVFIAMMGLMALVTLIMTSKTKEVGIRKVLGASIGSMVVLLSKEFLILASLGLIIAFPLSHFFMSDWLTGFHYRITLDWQIYAIAGVIGVFVTSLTVGWQTIKTALLNPVNSLRNE